MAQSRFQHSIRSLKDLDRLFIQRELKRSAQSGVNPAQKTQPGCGQRAPNGTGANHQTEEELFQQAMADVEPLRQRSLPRIAPLSRAAQRPAAPGESEGVQALTALVREGKNFIVEFTSEYIEGRGCRVPPEITRQLHQGRFSIQDHLDLHGHSVTSAQEILHGFFKEALSSGKNAVLIIHGRGRSSAGRPVLKAMVQNWLRRGPFRKHMVAYASARPCDGGTGATYVLLRRRPLPKRWPKKGLA